MGCGGTVLYGACEADWEGLKVPFGIEYIEGCGEGLLNWRSAAVGGKGVEASPSPNSSSDDEEAEMIETPSSSSTEYSEPEEDPDTEDGAYSCFSGEDERRWVLWAEAGDASFGVFAPLSCTGLDSR